jgi:glutathione S-transferase
MKYVFNNLLKQAPWIIKSIINDFCNKMNTLLSGPNIRSHSDFLESELGQRRWLAGKQFSGVDIQVIISVFDNIISP